MKVIRHHWGLKIGPFKDCYEIAVKADRHSAVTMILAAFAKMGFPISGRGYDGAFTIEISRCHGVAFYVRDGFITFEDHFHSLMWFRLGPSWLRRRLPGLIRPLL